MTEYPSVELGVTVSILSTSIAELIENASLETDTVIVNGQ